LRASDDRQRTHCAGSAAVLDLSGIVVPRPCRRRRRGSPSGGTGPRCTRRRRKRHGAHVPGCGRRLVWEERSCRVAGGEQRAGSRPREPL